MRRDSSVGIATRYGPDGLAIESGGARFSAPIHSGSRAHTASYSTGTGLFPEVKRPGGGVNHPPPFISEGKERIELYPRISWGSTSCVQLSRNYILRPKVSASRVLVASRVVNPKHDELRPAVSKELHPLHRKTRVYKMPNNWKVLVYKSQQHAQVGIYVLEYYYDARTHEH